MGSQFCTGPSRGGETATTIAGLRMPKNEKNFLELTIFEILEAFFELSLNHIEVAPTKQGSILQAYSCKVNIHDYWSWHHSSYAFILSNILFF